MTPDPWASSTSGHWLQHMQRLQHDNESLQQSLRISQEIGAQLHEQLTKAAQLLQRDPGAGAGAREMPMTESLQGVSVSASSASMVVSYMAAVIDQHAWGLSIL